MPENKKKKGGLSPEAEEAIAKRAAARAAYARNPGTPEPTGPEPAAAISTDDDADPAVVEFCSDFDHSDTDNAKRLKAHFGRDLLVIAQEKAKEPLYAVWTGTHWDIANGRQKALAIAQRLGDRIAAEAKVLGFNEYEQFMVDKAISGLELEGLDGLSAVDKSALSPAKKKAFDEAEKAIDALGKRMKRRMDHAVTSKNVAKLNAMLACLAPHIMRSADDFNADKLQVAVKNATLRFTRRLARQKNPRFRSVDETPDAPEVISVCVDSQLEVTEGHRRDDLITHVIPVKYDPKADCARWKRFLETKLPNAEVRKLVQISSGLGLLGISVQYLFFHYGNGANGKSVYMETLCRVLGEVAVTLPATSFVGENGSSGGASPDIARLYGRRMLRVKELPEGEDLKEALVKEVTGGETLTARDLFSGYLDFLPTFIAMMSGNGYPRITGMDDGIWRRMAVIHWPIQIAEEDRREFEEVLADFVPEYPGILNWMIEGVHMFLREGIVIPQEVKRATQEYRDDMDKTAAFVARCIIKREDAEPVSGKDLYQAFCDFTIDQGGKPMNNTAFGRAMAKKFRKEKVGGVVLYYGIDLVNVPSQNDAPPPDWEDIPDAF